MKVFGDGDIHLNQYDYTVVDKDQYDNVFSNRDVYMDLPYNIANTGTSMKVTGGDHTFYVNDFWETVSGQCTGYRYYFSYWQPEPGWQIYYQPLEWDFDESFTMTAYFNKQYHLGDVDGDGDRDQADLDEFSNAYPSTRGEYPYNYVSTCDFDSDGDIDSGDRDYLYGFYEKAFYHLDEGSGSTASDSSIYDNDGTVYGATWTTGISDSALSFDGSNDYVEVPHDTSISGLPSVTVMQWVKLDTVPSSNSVNLGGILNEYWLEYRSNQYLSLSTYINSNYDGQGFSANLADGDWHLITMTYNGTHKKGYLDGEPMATYQISGTLDDTNNAFKIGASFPASQGYNGCPDGVIDEVRVYDRALSNGEIADAAFFSLTVDGYCDDYYYYPDIAEVYIDGQYAGSIDQSFDLLPGQHTIEVYDFQYYYWYYEFQYYVIDGNNYYNNPKTFTINSDKTIEVHYYEIWW